MNARLAVLITALETLVVVGIGVGLFFAPLSVVWALDDAFSTDLLGYWRASADLWLLGHGVPISVSLAPETAQSLGLLAGQSQFVLSVAPLGPALITLWFGFRMGRRDLVLDYPVIVWVTSLVTLTGLSWAIAWSAQHPSAQFPFIEAIVTPSLFLATGLVIASWTTKWSPGRQWLRGVLPERAWQVISTGVTSGIATVALLIGVVSFILATSIVLSYATVIGLFESLNPSVVGLVALFVGQLVLVPTMIVWLSAWVIGPGFYLGQAAQFSPLGTDVQALPAVPLFAALPQEVGSNGLTIVVLPVLAAVIAGALAERGLGHPASERFWLPEVNPFQQPPIRGLITAAVATLTGVLVLSVPLMLTTGSLGPGRFERVGVDLSAVLAWWAIEVGLGTLLGLAVGRAVRWIRTQERRADASVSR